MENLTCRRDRTRSPSNKSAQEAHEAIRPTDVHFFSSRRPSLKESHYSLQADSERFVASQMTDAQWDATTVLVSGEDKNPARGLKEKFSFLIFP